MAVRTMAGCISGVRVGSLWDEAESEPQREDTCTMPSSSFPRRGFMVASSALLAGLGHPGTGDAALPSPVSLDADLERLRLRYRLPGAAALVLRAGQTVARGVAGRR